MGLANFIETKIKSMTVCTIGILKLLLFVTGMIFGGYYSAFVLNNITWFYLAFFVLLFLLLYKVFKK